VKPIRLLLIEDDEDDIALFQDLLGEAELEFELTQVKMSSEALEKLKVDTFDCVISDYIVPTSSGLDIMLKARDMGINTPFIIMTGWGDGGLGEEVIKRGAFDFACKGDLNSEMLSNKIIKATKAG